MTCAFVYGIISLKATSRDNTSALSESIESLKNQNATLERKSNFFHMKSEFLSTTDKRQLGTWILANTDYSTYVLVYPERRYDTTNATPTAEYRLLIGTPDSPTAYMQPTSSALIPQTSKKVGTTTYIGSPVLVGFIDNIVVYAIDYGNTQPETTCTSPWMIHRDTLFSLELSQTGVQQPQQFTLTEAHAQKLQLPSECVVILNQSVPPAETPTESV
jgi:hypothetical protein